MEGETATYVLTFTLISGEEELPTEKELERWIWNWLRNLSGWHDFDVIATHFEKDTTKD